MKASNYQKSVIDNIILECEHTEQGVRDAIKSYISENDRRYGEFSIGDIKTEIVLDNHYDEETGELINDDWQTTVSVSIVDNNISVDFY